MKKLFYTFRTNKHVETIKRQVQQDVFIFGNLKKDLKIFLEMIQNNHINQIVGCAEVKGKTRIESIAVNKFGSNKRIQKNGVDSYRMDISDKNTYPISNKHTTSFCNWTMYKLAQYIYDNKLNIKNSFIHYNKVDILDIIKTLK